MDPRAMERANNMLE